MTTNRGWHRYFSQVRDYAVVKALMALTRIGGTMLSHDLLLHFQSDITLINSWWLDGKHYARTLEAWLQLQDRHAKQGLAELERDADSKGMGKEEGRKVFYRWAKLSNLSIDQIFSRLS
jgi:hypothetical protein